MSARKARRSAAQWRDYVAQYNKDEASELDYCKAHDLTLASFRKWRYKFNAQDCCDPLKKQASDPGGFGPIHITPSPSSHTAMCLELPGGVRLHTNEIPPVEYLAQLTRVFGHEC